MAVSDFAVSDELAFSFEYFVKFSAYGTRAHFEVVSGFNENHLYLFVKIFLC